MKTLLEFILNRLVDHPEEVAIDSSVEGTSEVYTISVHPDDIGRVIGKQGSVINAIRTIAKIRAMKEGIHVSVNVANE